MHVVATPLCQTCLETLWYTPKLRFCFYSVQNDINSLFHLAQMRAGCEQHTFDQCQSDYVSVQYGVASVNHCPAKMFQIIFHSFKAGMTKNISIYEK